MKNVSSTNKLLALIVVAVFAMTACNPDPPKSPTQYINWGSKQTHVVKVGYNTKGTIMEVWDGTRDGKRFCVQLMTMSTNWGPTICDSGGSGGGFVQTAVASYWQQLVKYKPRGFHWWVEGESQWKHPTVWIP